MGTAEEAAAAAGESGADYSPYCVSEPLEGYVARQFTLPIAALNQPFDMATFSGGRNGAEEGVWYTRTVVFCSSAEVEAAVATAASRAGESVARSDSPSSGASGLAAPKFKVSAKKVKARAGKKTVVKPGKAFKVTGRAGKVVYAKIKGNGKIAVSPKGKVTVKKGLKAGKTYKVKVLVVDFGSKKAAASAKIVSLKVKVAK